MIVDPSPDALRRTLRRRPGRAGALVVIEGVNGAGKSLLVSALTARLAAAGRSPFPTREPGATPLGRALRRLLLTGAVAPESPLAEFFLFAADRAEHVAARVSPALGRGEVVLSDRYYISGEAFQGAGRALPAETVETVNRMAVGDAEPDLVILLDLDAAAGLARAAARTAEGAAEESGDRLEAEALAFHERVRARYLEAARLSPLPFVVIDARLSPDEVADRAYEAVTVLLSAARAP